VFAATALGAVAAGCGGGEEADGPSAAVPENAPVYVEATVRPEGEAADDANAAIGKILDSPNGGAQLVALIEQAAASEGDTVNFEEDVSPWLGERAGVFFSSFEGEGVGAVILESTDTDAAVEFFSNQGSSTGRTAEYEGHEYEFDEDGDVFGAVGDFVVSGDEEGFKEAVDANEGDSLGETDEFNESVDDQPEDSLGLLYALPENLLNAISDDELDAQSREFIEKTSGDALNEPVLGSVTASGESIDLQLSAGSNGVETPQSTLLETLPGESWLGLSFGNVGDAIQRGLDSAEEQSVEGFDIEQVRSQVLAATGLELDQITDALGGGAVFVEGTSEANLAGALVLQTEDAQTTGTLLTKLQTLLQQAGPSEVRVRPLASATGDAGFELVDPSGEIPRPVQIIQQGDKVVVGYGPGSSTKVLQPGQTLASVPAFSAAAERLSDLGVDAFLSFAPVFQLAEAEGAGADPDFQAAKPYIDNLDYLAVGSGDEDDRALVRLIVGLK
jgi:Protein of unknown function (DUF3352)